MRELFELFGQVALVTGGWAGLGAEMGGGLPAAGASLVLLARREQWLQPAVERFRARGFQCEGALCDVADPAAVRRVLEGRERVDILVNNAGVTWGQPAEEMPLERCQAVIDTNLA